jgi:hypothetical protein
MPLLRRNLVIFALAVLTACVGGLPRSLREQIALETNRLREAERQLQRSQEKVHQDEAQAPDLFHDSAVPAEWDARLQNARDKLNSAEVKGREMADLARRGRADSRFRAERLISDERNLRESAVRDAALVESAANKWVAFPHDLPSHLSEMNREYQAVRAADLAPVSQIVQQAEKDWPAKKGDLDNRLAALHEIQNSAETQWKSTETARADAAAGKARGAELATLIQTDDALSNDAANLTAKTEELRSLSGQLYDSWDKILTDLDVSRFEGEPIYRERIKTVRTHFTDVASHKTETTQDERWVDVPEGTYHAVENDLGMAIAHKDAGLFDSEAQTTPQPAGFAYIAPVSQGSNQYGYWTHAGGESVWTFLPQYLLLRELLWNHDYRPVPIGEYTAYRTAERSGRSYYGQSTPTAAPKYGTHGTFTQTHYAQSRYVQSGGFKGSAYASRSAGSSSRFEEPHAGSRSVAPNNGTAGRRFGFGAGPGGKRFGSPGGFRSPGRGFGRRR